MIQGGGRKQAPAALRLRKKKMADVTGHTPTKEIPDAQTVLEKFEGSPQDHGPVGRKFFIFFALSSFFSKVITCICTNIFVALLERFR